MSVANAARVAEFEAYLQAYKKEGIELIAVWTSVHTDKPLEEPQIRVFLDVVDDQQVGFQVTVHHLVEHMDLAGMDGKAVDADVAANPEKYDAILKENADAHTACGHGGVPVMSFRGEPFFGQDRFDVFLWRLKQNGLTKRAGDACLTT